MADGQDLITAACAAQPAQSHASQVKSRVIFDKAIGQADRPVRHDKTSVLLLGWDPKIDDTGAAGEVSHNRRLFFITASLTCG